jgi:hypothetical protein
VKRDGCRPLFDFFLGCRDGKAQLPTPATARLRELRDPTSDAAGPVGIDKTLRRRRSGRIIVV